MITKALIIDEPWISKILAGDKVWEMRSNNCALRGPFALIRKGSGMVVGVAKLVNASGPYSNTELENHFSKHHVGSEIISQPGYKWHHAWELADAKALAQPVVYKHKSGSVIWVNLDENAIEKVNAKAGGSICTTHEIEVERHTEQKTMKVEEDSIDFTSDSDTSFDSVTIQLSQGNINNNHIYLSSVISFFPKESIGGANKTSLAPKMLTIDTGIEESVQTDIAGDKKIFRDRAMIRRFMQVKRLKAGDSVQIQRTGDLAFKLIAERACT